MKGFCLFVLVLGLVLLCACSVSDSQESSMPSESEGVWSQGSGDTSQTEPENILESPDPSKTGSESSDVSDQNENGEGSKNLASSKEPGKSTPAKRKAISSDIPAHTPQKSPPPASRTEPAQTPSAPAEPPKQEASSEPPQKTETPTLPWVTQPPKSFTQADHNRIISEVTAYAESYRAKGFTFEWDDSLEFSWESGTGWMGTPRVKYDGVDGVIEMLKYHVDKIVKVATDPSNCIPSSIANYKVMQVTVDGDIAFVVLYG